jgi:hypothetical protein
MAATQPALRAYLTNCLVAGHTVTRNGDGAIRDTITFDCGGKTYILKQYSEVIQKPSGFRNTCSVTSELFVADVKPNEVAAVLKAIDRICWLLSLAGLSKVAPFGHDYPADSGNQVRSQCVGVAQYFRPTIDIRRGSIVKSFLEQTYPTYVRLEKARNLNVVIDYLVQAERPDQPTECKLIFGFVLLENLKHSFARSVPLHYEKGAFRKTPHPKAAKYSFEELLHLMLAAVKMRRGLKRLIKLRNELVHSGLSGKTHSQNFRMYELLHNLLREYILRLLKYQGDYLSYASAGRAIKTI